MTTIRDISNEVYDTYDLRNTLEDMGLRTWIEDCISSGDNSNSCLELVRHLNLRIPRDKCIDELLEWNWDSEELEKETDEALNAIYLWIACWHDSDLLR